MIRRIIVLRLDRFCFFKQKTAYEIRKGDWSSDVCSSDLLALLLELGDVRTGRERHSAGAAIDDRPYRLVLREPFSDARQLRPHREADRVAHGRTVDDDRRDRPVVLYENIGHPSHLGLPSVDG